MGSTDTTSYPDIPNPGSDAVPYYTPAQNPPAGSAVSADAPTLFKPLKVRGVTLQNRMFLSPLCQYSADDGHLTEWHAAHLGGIISRGPGLSFVEATSVQDIGRITPQDAGMWKDSHAEAAKRIVDFAHSQNQHIGIQLGHAGRKASTVAPWIPAGGVPSSAAVGGWPDKVIGASPVAFSSVLPVPHEMSLDDIAQFKKDFLAAVHRSLQAGFDVIEIHAAHGYLLSSFLSPTSNKRSDKYGGSWDNRARLIVEVAEETRKALPDSVPLFMRISATEWLEDSLPDEPSWRVEDSIKLAQRLVGIIDLLDVSSGGNHSKQHIKGGPVAIGGKESDAYHAPFANEIKKAIGDKMLVAVVGGIKDGRTAQDLLDGGLDAILVGRMFQKNPGLVFQFADELNTQVKMPNQIGWGFKGRGKS